MITTGIERITPEIAGVWLLKNNMNRPLRRSSVDTYSAAMRLGNWALNGDSVKFDVTGNIIDGQHRLSAVVDSGVEIESVVIRGLPREVFETVDTGNSRRVSDVLSIGGEKNTTKLASALTLLDQYEKHQLTGYIENCRARPQACELQKVLDRNRGLIDSVTFITTLPNRRIVSVSVCAAMHYIFSQIDQEMASRFFTDLYGGVNLSEGNSIFTLREKLIETKFKRVSYNRQHIVVFIIKAWNAFYNDKQCKKIVWNSSTIPPESIPRIAGLRYEQDDATGNTHRLCA